MVAKFSRAGSSRIHFSVLLAMGAVAVSACGVDSTGADTGGVESSNDDSCPGGVAVVLSDYVSTQIALSSLEGETQSASLISTASTDTDGLAFALSGDVVLPSAPADSGRIVLLDRFGTNVITWVDPTTAEVLDQLPVGTGFESNPQDYVEVGDDIAFVSRWGTNADPDQEDFDGGDDVVVIDTSEPAIVGRIAMPTADDLPARPGALARLGDEVIVVLDRVSEDYSTTGEAMLVGLSIEDRKVVWEQTLEGLKACGRPTLSPDGSRLAVACSGALTAEGNIEDIAQSTLVLFDAKKTPLEEVERYSAEDIAGEPIQSSVAFASDDIALLKTQTAWGGDSNNRWLGFDLTTGKAETLLEASSDPDGAGLGLVYTGMTCAPGCSTTCLLADGDAGVIQRVRLESDGSLELLDPITVEDTVGLPPRGLSLR